MQLNVTTTPTRITARKTAQISIRNVSSVTVWLGNSREVTPSTGFPLKENEAYEMPQEVVAHGDLWAVTASGTADLRVLIVG